MSETDKLTWDLSLQHSDTPAISTMSDDRKSAKLTNVLRVFGSSGDGYAQSAPNRNSPPQDWSQLIERVRSAALRVREVEADAHDQELRVRELLKNVQEDIKTANERVRAAEAHARDIQNRADALLKAADDRVRAAEERARVAEEWLTQLSITIIDGFGDSKTERLIA
ncbi:hypothetical protein [Methylobacterium sp. Leaf87]|uniref:hypothetical protein n=1 Tax=Methylobacterium sp. Leaf87 TaxID=1736243 RepID=UPI0012E74401|nr:hypothetical protein [Methylobacterium sp. Leaf87]